VRASNTPPATSSARATSSAKPPIQPHVPIPSPPHPLSTDPHAHPLARRAALRVPHRSAAGHVRAPAWDYRDEWPAGAVRRLASGWDHGGVRCASRCCQDDPAVRGVGRRGRRSHRGERLALPWKDGFELPCTGFTLAAVIDGLERRLDPPPLSTSTARPWRVSRDAVAAAGRGAAPGRRQRAVRGGGDRAGHRGAHRRRSRRRTR
jgi:hypothetical protein